MAVLKLNYYSKALAQSVSVNVILPGKSAKSPRKTLYLLHGRGHDYDSWLNFSSIARYASERELAVIMPNAGRFWYTNTANNLKYFTFLTEELPAACKTYFNGISDQPENTLIAGVSMGGYGAIKAAFCCPQVFGKCAALSGAIDIWSDFRIPEMAEWRTIFGHDLQHPSQLAGTNHDIFAIAKKNREAGISFPKLYIWCGKDDRPGLVDTNRQFHEELCHLEVPHLYEESEGDHNWKWWDLHIQTALDYLLTETK